MACAKSSVMLRLWLLLACIVFSAPSFEICPPCEFVSCSPLPKSCSNSSVYYDDCGCCLRCGLVAGERCGASAEECARGLRCARRLGDTLGEDRTGVCEHEVCENHVCGYRQRCQVKYRQIDCVCPKYNCNGKSNPVCGYDGNTYASVCHLQKTECLNNKFIGIRYFGSCPVTEPPPPTLATKTNAIPTLSDEDYEFFQGFAPTPETGPTVPRGCIYKSELYELNRLTRLDECRYLFCNSEATLKEVFVPGCASGPPEPDYHVEKPVVRGGWSDWSNWTDCIGDGCYSSFHSRNRSCTKPRPQNEGPDCDGEATEVTSCIPIPCQLNHTCEHSEWSDWSDCSATCGFGTRVRMRELLNDIPRVPDEDLCVMEEQERCRVQKCPKPCRTKKRSVTLINERNCTSVKPYDKTYCAGDCLEPGFHCRPSKYTSVAVPVTCPGDLPFRDHYFEVISECGCLPEDTVLLPEEEGSST